MHLRINVDINSLPMPPERVEQLGPSNFGFGESIVRELRIWLDAWTANFADAPAEDSHTWRLGFD